MDIITLSREDALKSHKICTSDGSEHILVTDSVVYCEKNADGTELHFVSDRKISFRVFPGLAATGETAKYSVETGDWSASGACDVMLEVDELKKDAPVYLEQWPEFSSNGIMKVSSIKARAYHEVTARI